MLGPGSDARNNFLTPLALPNYRAKNGQLGVARPQQCFSALDKQLGSSKSLALSFRGRFDKSTSFFRFFVLSKEPFRPVQARVNVLMCSDLP